MTAPRRYGEDTPFGKWLRLQPDLDSQQDGFTANDADWIFHKYRTKIDAEGTRNVQLLMICEVKTQLAEPNKNQMETLFFHHQLLKNHGFSVLKTPSGPKISVWHFGVFVLSIAGDFPVDGFIMRWGIFKEDGKIKWHNFKLVSSIKNLLGFIWRPDNPGEPLDLRRHHKTQTISQISTVPLGFETPRRLIVKS